MNYNDVIKEARTCIGTYCKACPVCNGVACKNQIPGPGAKGVGDTAVRNYQKWQDSVRESTGGYFVGTFWTDF